MARKKKYPKLEHVELLENDATGHPSIGTMGLFTSVDICRIFDDIKMDAFQEWLKRELIRPHIVDIGPTGWIKYFNRSGLCMIAMFKRFVDLGIPRVRARNDMMRFHERRLGHLSTYLEEPDFIILTIENKFIHDMATVTGTIETHRDMKDIAVINFYRILLKIDSYSK